MNKQIDLISTGEVMGITEGRGWELGQTHQRLTEFAREGRLRSWGYKGNSAELKLIDPFIWQDHGLGIANEQLVISKKIFAPDYAQRTWRDVHWDRREIEDAFPPYSLWQIGFDPATPHPGETGEAGCRNRFLIGGDRVATRQARTPGGFPRRYLRSAQSEGANET
jgi:hypothetical protein